MDKRQLSIHPRSWPDGNRVKKNTCADSSLKERAARQLAGIEKHLEQHPGDSMSQTRVARLKQILSA